VLHGISALLFVTMSMGHIYLGSVGVDGAYDAMRTGYVDEIWAKEHHEYWYRESVAADPAKGGGGAANPAAASPMKEGWK